MNRPETTEYDPYYHGYVSLVADEDIVPQLEEQSGELRRLLDGRAEDLGTFIYAPGKWTVKELLSHIIDAERVFAYRVLRISRGDETPIEGFEQDGYIVTSNANNRSFASLLDEFEMARRSNIIMIRGLTPDAGTRMGTASGKPVSVQALVYIMAGHAMHHTNILRERYIT